MKVVVNIDADVEDVILDILYDLSDNSISEITDEVIEKAIRNIVERDTDKIIDVCTIPSSTMLEIKKAFINYLNNLINQLS